MDVSPRPGRLAGTGLPAGCSGLWGVFGWFRRFGAGSGGADHLPQGFALAGGVVPLGLWLMLEPPAHSDDGDGGVGQAGQVARQSAVAHPGPLLVPGSVADIVEPVLDFPVAPGQGEYFRTPPDRTSDSPPASVSGR